MKWIAFTLLSAVLLTICHGHQILRGRDDNARRSMFSALTDSEMAAIVGADSCRDCRYIGLRLDECYHSGTIDPCQSGSCIANYAIDYTCDPGTGTCNAYKNYTGVSVIQYARVDSGCTTNFPIGLTTWITRYFDHSCSTFVTKVRCQKNNGSCGGTLIDTASRTPAIQCN